jgi:formamidopyrimidine-DNA glycosylase
MPELPEVETIARDLRGLVAGARIVGARSNWPKTLRSHEPDAFAAAVAGREIVAIGRRGKQLLVMLGPAAGDVDGSESGAGERSESSAGDGSESGASDRSIDLHAGEPAVLTVHLKMTGQLFVVPAGTPQDRHVHLVLELADGRELRFRDMRKFGRVGLYRRDPSTGVPPKGEADGVLPRGAEPLSDEFTLESLFDMLARRRGRLKTLLMNQDFLAGVGNIYADESLWRARLHPLRDARSLRPDEVRRLYGALLDVLSEAVMRRGSSVDDYTAPGGDGSMQERLAVYQRTGEPCQRCGRPIRRIVVGGRSTHFCGWCQRLPAEQRAAAAKLLERAAGAAGAADPAGAAGAAGAARATDRIRRGPRWTELSGENPLGRTAHEEARAKRLAATREAAALRRAAARAGGPA